MSNRPNVVRVLQCVFLFHATHSVADLWACLHSGYLKAWRIEVMRAS